MKKSKVIGTIWILIISLFIGTIIFGLSGELFNYFQGDIQLSQVPAIGILGSVFSFFYYGIIFWPPTILLMLIIELALVRNDDPPKKLLNYFVVELLIIAPTFVYFAIEHNYPTWYYFIVVLAIGQLLRWNYLRKKWRSPSLND